MYFPGEHPFDIIAKYTNMTKQEAGDLVTARGGWPKILGLLDLLVRKGLDKEKATEALRKNEVPRTPQPANTLYKAPPVPKREKFASMGDYLKSDGFLYHERLRRQRVMLDMETAARKVYKWIKDGKPPAETRRLFAWIGNSEARGYVRNGTIEALAEDTTEDLIMHLFTEAAARLWARSYSHLTADVFAYLIPGAVPGAVFGEGPVSGLVRPSLRSTASEEFEEQVWDFSEPAGY